MTGEYHLTKRKQSVTPRNVERLIESRCTDELRQARFEVKMQPPARAVDASSGVCGKLILSVAPVIVVASGWCSRLKWTS